MKTQRFHIGAVLTIVTGRLVALEGMDAVYAILNFMTRDDLYTHQLPRAWRECQPYLERRFPQLAALKPEIEALMERTGREQAPAVVRAWTRERAAEHGEYFDVEEIPRDDHERRDPVEELREMAPQAEVIVVKPGGVE